RRARRASRRRAGPKGTSTKYPASVPSRHPQGRRWRERRTIANAPNPAEAAPNGVLERDRVLGRGRAQTLGGRAVEEVGLRQERRCDDLGQRHRALRVRLRDATELAPDVERDGIHHLTRTGPERAAIGELRARARLEGLPSERALVAHELPAALRVRGPTRAGGTWRHRREREAHDQAVVAGSGLIAAA